VGKKKKGSGRKEEQYATDVAQVCQSGRKSSSTQVGGKKKRRGLVALRGPISAREAA